MPNHPTPRQPEIVDGELISTRPAPPSPLDPDRSGTWPTALRPTPPELRGPRPGPLARLLAALVGER